VERFHRTLKAAIMCHADQNWTEALSLVLLASAHNLKWICKHPVHPAYLITQLRQYITRLRPVPATHHANSGTFIHKDLTNCTHVFLRQDSNWSGPPTSLQRPQPGLVPETQNAKTHCARKTHHCVCRQDQACLHIQ
jgi:cleavage and polyadenylation specificity factor subunit 1